MAHQLLQFFEYKHLPDKLQPTSILFGELAKKLDLILPENPEKTVSIRKLLESKDCAVRSVIYSKEPQADKAG